MKTEKTEKTYHISIVQGNVYKSFFLTEEDMNEWFEGEEKDEEGKIKYLVHKGKMNDMYANEFEEITTNLVAENWDEISENKQSGRKTAELRTPKGYIQISIMDKR